MKVEFKTRFKQGLAPKVAMKTLAVAALALTGLVAHGKGGRWEATLILGETLGQDEVAVVRIGEENGRMAVTGAEFPAVTVMASARGWHVAKPGEFATDGQECLCSVMALKLTFWGSEENHGLMVAEVMTSPGGAWKEVPQLGFVQEHGWSAPASLQEERWTGDIGQLALETGSPLSFCEIRYIRIGSLFMVR